MKPTDLRPVLHADHHSSRSDSASQTLKGVNFQASPLVHFSAVADRPWLRKPPISSFLLVSTKITGWQPAGRRVTDTKILALRPEPTRRHRRTDSRSLTRHRQSRGRRPRRGPMVQEVTGPLPAEACVTPRRAGRNAWALQVLVVAARACLAACSTDETPSLIDTLPSDRTATR